MTTRLPIEALDHVALTVSDPDRSMQWYQDILGFQSASMEAGPSLSPACGGR